MLTDTDDREDTNRRSLLPRAFGAVAAYLTVVITLQAALVWYGRNTYGPENNHPASVSEALGTPLGLLLGAGIAGSIALVWLVLYWLSAFIWPRRLRGRETEVKVLKIGLVVALVATILLYRFVTRID